VNESVTAQTAVAEGPMGTNSHGISYGKPFFRKFLGAGVLS